MEAVIGEVVVVIVSIAIAIAAATWITGIWTGEQQEFMITPILTISSTNSLHGQGSSGLPVLQLIIDNKGGKLVKIVMVKVTSGKGSYVNKSVISVPAGSEVTVTIKDWQIEGSPDPVEPGNVYRIIIYTDNAGQFFFDITAS